MADLNHSFFQYTSHFGLEINVFSCLCIYIVATGLKFGVKLLKRIRYGILIAVSLQTLNGSLEPPKANSTNVCCIRICALIA